MIDSDRCVFCLNTDDRDHGENGVCEVCQSLTPTVYEAVLELVTAHEASVAAEP